MKLTVSFTILLLLATALQITSHANPMVTEVTPAENINPSSSDPILNNLAQPAAIANDKKSGQTSNNIKAKSEPSWWSWLTSSSSKPAYFHYVDFIELIE